jgi:hypothetical protein
LYGFGPKSVIIGGDVLTLEQELNKMNPKITDTAATAKRIFFMYYFILLFNITLLPTVKAGNPA